MCLALQQRLCGTLRRRRARKTAKKRGKKRATKSRTVRTAADVWMAIAKRSGPPPPPRSRASRNARRSPARSRQKRAPTMATPRTSPAFLLRPVTLKA